mmetsp:Transcript_19366/g.27707  ORF Transcript_19366/g.27707 Transcript_19366/m.27707 type:complete len:297 (+) Transcript_19366:55-945(+)
MKTLVEAKEPVAGAAAGIIGTVLGFPFDTVKTTMQIHHKSMGTSIISIYKQSGIIGFYKGIGSPLVALTLLNTINFSSYAFFCNLFGLQHDTIKMNNGIFEWRLTASAALVGPISSLISTPFELVKTQMQLSSTSNPKVIWKNSLHAAIELSKRGRNGPLYLYTGHSVNTLREIVFLSTYFSVYEYFKYHLAEGYSHLSKTVTIPISGGIAGAIGWFVSFPLDLVKSNIQQQPPSGYIIHTNGKFRAISIAKDILKKRGLVGLYSGVVPSLMRAFIVSSSRFTVYEGTMSLIETYC